MSLPLLLSGGPGDTELLGGILCLLFAGAAGVGRASQPGIAWRWASPLGL